MKQTKELIDKLESLKYELKLKNNVDGHSARYDSNIPLTKAELKGRLDILESVLIDYCSEEEYLYWILGYLFPGGASQGIVITDERAKNISKKRIEISEEIKQIKLALNLCEEW